MHIGIDGLVYRFINLMSMKTNSMSVERLATAPTRPAADESVELMDWSSAFLLLYLKKSQISFRELYLLPLGNI